VRGRRSEPAAKKEAKGNPGRRPVGRDLIPAEISDVIVAPEWLAGDALVIWQDRAPKLAKLKLLTESDVTAFARYCRNFARWLKMQKTLDDEGETYESESTHGKLKRAHPAFMISDRLERQLLAAEDRFGLNPAERQRIFAMRASLGANPGELPLEGGFGNRPDEQPRPPAGPVGLLN
jgi:P27 family predicted phage terminase small subunit